MKKKIGIVITAIIAVVAIILGVSKISDRISTTYQGEEERVPSAFETISKISEWNDVQVDDKTYGKADKYKRITKSDVTKSIYINIYDTLRKNNQFFCIQKGIDWQAFYTVGETYNKYTVATHYTINANGKITTYDTRDTGKLHNTTIQNDKKAVVFHNAMVYVMADAKSNCKDCRTKGTSGYKNCTHQKAIWGLTTDYGWGGGDNTYRGNSTDIAKKANAYGNYAYSFIKNPVADKTTYKDSEKKEPTYKKEYSNYTVYGPYKVTYPTGSYSGQEFGGIKSVSKSDGVEICDKNGKTIGNPSSGQEFYIKLNKGKETGTIKFTFNTPTLSGEYFRLTKSGYQDMVLGNGKFSNSTTPLTITVKAEKPKDGEYTINLNKIDSVTKQLIDGTEFGIYRVSIDGNGNEIEHLEDRVVPTNSEAGSYTIKIGESDYSEDKDHIITYRIKEILTPKEYQSLRGYIELKLTIGIKDNKYVVIKTNTEEVNTNLPNGIAIESKTDNSNITLSVPNVPYPNYEVVLNKEYRDENNNKQEATQELLKNTEFKIIVQLADTASGVGDIVGTFNLGTNSKMEDKQITLGNIDVLIENGTLKINLIPKASAPILIKIEETKSPNGYTILEKPIIIQLNMSYENRTYTIKSVTTDSESDKANEDSVQYKQLDINKADILVSNDTQVQEEETILQITKYSSETDSNGNKIPLPGVKFGVYNLKNELIDTITTNDRGIASYHISYKVGIKNFEEYLNSYDIGKNLGCLPLTIKEIEGLDGYQKLSSDESVEIKAYYGFNLNKTGIMTNEIEVENKTSQTIETRVTSSTGNVTQNVKTQEKIQFINEKLKDYQNADWHNGTCNYSAFLSEMKIDLGIENQKIEEGSYSIKLVKVDANNNQVLSGAKFGLYDKRDAGGYDLEGNTASNSTINPIATAITNENGEITFNILLNKEGQQDYYVMEIEGPDGYVSWTSDEYVKLSINVEARDAKYVITKVEIFNSLNEDKSIKIQSSTGETVLKSTYNSDEGKDIAEFTSDIDNIAIIVPNYKEVLPGEYNISILKTAANSNDTRKLEGAKFELFNELNESQGIYTTDENGIIDINKQLTKEEYNNRTIVYYLKEIVAPQGYDLIDGMIQITLFISKNNTNYYVQSVDVSNRTNIKIKLGDIEIQENETKNMSVVNNQIGLIIRNEAKIDLALKKFITGVTDNQGNYTATTGREPTYNTESLKTTTEATYTFDKTKPVEVSKGNIVRYTIRIYNEGQSDGYASEIKDYLPNGVKLAENSSVNNTYGWTIGEDENGQYITSTYLKDQKIGKYEGGITLNYKDIEVELEVTMTDMYLGTLKNVAEIAEMKDQEGNVIPNDVDSSTEGTTITRGGETITDYKPKEDDIDYDWIKLKDGIPFAGKVWLDVPEENTKDTENSLLDSHESFDKIKENGGVIAEIYQVKNGQMILIATTPVNDDGTYEFKDIKKSDDGVNYNNYVIQFKYHGINYTNVEYKVGTDYKINSKAQEDALERTAFNNKFATINNQSEITYITTSDDGSKKLTSKYNYTDNMKMTAKTETISLNINTDTDELLYFNLGLKQRPTFDMALYKDVDHATVTVNGQEQIYTYDKYSSYNPESGTFDEFAYTVRNSDYNLGIRSVDRTEDAGLSIYVTYKINLINQSNTYGYVSKLVDYYDSHYTYASAQVKNNAGEIVDVGLTVTPHEESTISSSDANYYKMDINVGKNTNTILDNNENLYIYITLQFKDPASSLQTLSDGNNLRTMNFAEIAEYQTFNSKDGNVTPGLIDIDSAPGNFNVATYKKGDYTEDDIDQAPALTYVDNGSMRTITGNVFEEIDNADDINIKDVKVELIEIDGSGNPIMENGSYRSLTYKVTSTDENGNYIFENYLPGNYMIRFSYGDSKQTVLTTANGGSNDTSYNGQDYASTDYIEENYADLYWYTSVTDKSDATDDGDRRNTVNEYSQTYNNAKAEILNSWKENPIDEGKIAELIDKTNMFADTANMTLSVEYGSTKVDSNSIPEYKVEGIDFGLKKRPTTDMVIKKEVSKVTVTSSSGETLVSSDMTQGPEGKSNNVLWVKDSLVKIELEDALINGANLQIEYKVTLKNESEEGAAPTKVTGIIDYVDNNLRFEEENNNEWEVVTAEELQKDNEEEPLVNNDIDLSKRQVILKASTDNPLLDKELGAGETLEEFATLTLTKTITTSNSAEDDLSYDNIIEIVETWNAEGRKTEGTPGDLPPDPDPNDPPHDPQPGEDSSEKVTISNPTGQTQIYYVLGITIGVILIIGIVCIKKFVLRKKD